MILSILNILLKPGANKCGQSVAKVWPKCGHGSKRAGTPQVLSDVRCRRCRHGARGRVRNCSRPVSAWICVAAPRGGTPPQTAPPPAQLGDDPCPLAHPPSAPPHATPFGGAHVCALVRLTTSVRGAPRAAPPKGKGAHIAVSATYSSPSLSVAPL